MADSDIGGITVGDIRITVPILIVQEGGGVTQATPKAVQLPSGRDVKEIHINGIRYLPESQDV